MEPTSSTPKNYTPTQGQSYTYKPVNSTAQGTYQYNPTGYTSTYKDSNNQPTSDSKGGNYLYQSQDLQAGNSYTPKDYGVMKNGADNYDTSANHQPFNSNTGANAGVNGGQPGYNTNPSQSSAYRSKYGQNTYKPLNGYNADISANVNVTYGSGENQPLIMKAPSQNQENSTPSNSVSTRLEDPSDSKLQYSGSYQVNDPLRYKHPATFGDAALTSQINKDYSHGNSSRAHADDKLANQKKLDLTFLNTGVKIEIKAAESHRIREGSPEQEQPVFNNVLYQPTEENKYPGITVSGPQERARNDPLARSVVDVRYELPEWYQQDKDTNLYENMYLIDAVRYTNSRLLHHSPARHTLQTEPNHNAVHRNPPLSPRHLEDHPNFSRKLETPRSARKWDKHIPRVILFVSKYNAGEMEDDVDNDSLMTPRRDYEPPKHSSPYYLENHQMAYHDKPQNSQLSQRNQRLSDVNKGYFDYEEYRAQLSSRVTKEPKTDLDTFEEDEGVRQTIRVSDITMKRRY